MMVSGTRVDFAGAEPSLAVDWASSEICDEDESIPSSMEDPRLPMKFEEKISDGGNILRKDFPTTAKEGDSFCYSPVCHYDIG